MFFPGRPFLAFPQLSLEWASESYGLPLHVFRGIRSGAAPAFIGGGATESLGIPPGEFAQFMGIVGSPVPAFGFAARGGSNTGHALVQFASSASQATTEAGTFAGSTALTWSVAIVASIQRLDGQDPTVSVSEPIQGALSARTTAFSSSTLVGMSSSSDPDVPMTTIATDESAPLGTGPIRPLAHRHGRSTLQLVGGIHFPHRVRPVRFAECWAARHLSEEKRFSIQPEVRRDRIARRFVRIDRCSQARVRRFRGNVTSCMPADGWLHYLLR